MKELIYIVTWCLVSWNPTVTLLHESEKYDEFGREIYNPIMLKETVDCGHSRTFISLDSAQEFYARALSSSRGFMYMDEGVLNNITLDSMDLNLYCLLRFIKQTQRHEFGIKRCPVCGAKGYIHQAINDTDNPSWTVDCTVYDVEGFMHRRVGKKWSPSVGEAIVEWNNSH